MKVSTKYGNAKVTLMRHFVCALFGAALISCGPRGSQESVEPGGTFARAEAAVLDAQVEGLSARHEGGQTILTWKEVPPTITSDSATVAEVRRLREELKDRRYRVYHATRPITSVDGLTPVAEVKPLTGWNTEYNGVNPPPELKALRYVIEEGKGPVPPRIAIFAHNPRALGWGHYAVTAVVDGRENKLVTPENSLRAPVEETVGPGVPVLQRVEQAPEFNSVQNPTLRYYVRWESQATSSVPGKPFDYLVGIPPRPATPAPVGIHLHAWGGNLNRDFGWWFNGEKGAILVATNEDPYDWWTGYHERIGTGQPLRTAQDWQAGVVRPYTQRRLLSFLDWVATKYDVDLERTFSAGSSMGGSGSLMLAIRFPERIAWTVSWVGVHRPAGTPQFKESYETVYGKPEWGVKFEDGTPVWQHYDDVWYLRQHPGKEIGLMVFSNGKNDGAIGWTQAAEFVRALQETRRPHLFVWGQGGHGQRAYMPRAGGERLMPLDLKVNQTLPAFTNSTLDNRPGDGRPENGDPEGQVNLYLYWETDDIIDLPDRWEMTVGVVKITEVPRSSGTVDVTPRRTQKFRAKPGERFAWTNVSLANHKTVQTGQATADAWGLVTLEQVTVSQGKNRIRIVRQ